MVGIAKDSVSLSKRVVRFLEREKQRDERLGGLLERLSAYDVYVFGGVLRDLALFGAKGFSSDIDLVHLGNHRSVEESIAMAGVRQNRFGGLRIATDFWFVDLWEARQTWAFRCGLKEYRGVDSLLETTITNWESVLFSLSNDRIICSERYFADLGRGYLDVVCEHNPNALGMYVRLLRAYVCKEAKLLSAKAAETIASGLCSYSLAEVNAYEASHYGQLHVNETAYKYLREHAYLGNPGLLAVELEGAQKALPLFGGHGR